MVFKEKKMYFSPQVDAIGIELSDNRNEQSQVNTGSTAKYLCQQ